MCIWPRSFVWGRANRTFERLATVDIHTGFSRELDFEQIRPIHAGRDRDFSLPHSTPWHTQYPGECYGPESMYATLGVKYISNCFVEDF